MQPVAQEVRSQLGLPDEQSTMLWPLTGWSLDRHSFDWRTCYADNKGVTDRVSCCYGCNDGDRERNSPLDDPLNFLFR